MINGHKWFSSNGSIADFLIVMAVTDPDARPHQRASMFIVDADTPGVNDRPRRGHDGASRTRASAATATTPRSSTRTSASRPTALLGAEGAGFLIAQQRLYPGRIHHCMRWLGVARRAFDMLCERSLYRYAHGSMLGKHQTVQNWIADSEAEMQAARLMTLHAAWKMDTEGVAAARKEIALIKFYGAKVLHDVVDRALQAHGGLGYSTDLPLEAMYRFARAARIYDGPDEVHRASVARQVLRGYEAPPDGVPDASTSPPAARRRGGSSPSCSRPSRPTTDRPGAASSYTCPQMAHHVPEKILLAAPRGYCAGVDRAVQTVERALELYGAPGLRAQGDRPQQARRRAAARARRGVRRVRVRRPRGRDGRVLGPRRRAQRARQRRAARACRRSTPPARW